MALESHRCSFAGYRRGPRYPGLPHVIASPAPPRSRLLLTPSSCSGGGNASTLVHRRGPTRSPPHASFLECGLGRTLLIRPPVPLSRARDQPWLHPPAEEATDLEAYLSTQRAKAGQAPRISSSDGRSCWSRRTSSPSPQGPGAAVGLIQSIRGRSGFDALRLHGRRVRCAPLWVRHVPGTEGEPAQVGYAIGRAVGNAVVRNRLRRRLRAILTELDRAGSLPPGVYMIGATPGAGEASFDHLSGQLERAVIRATKGGGDGSP